MNLLSWQTIVRCGLFTGFLVSLAGCGAGFEKPIASCSGTVTFEGIPVTGGTLKFAPVAKDPKVLPGKQAEGPIGSDGKFRMSTYNLNDGAVVGKGTLTFTPPAGVEKSPRIVNPDGSEIAAVIEPSPYVGCRVETAEMEIKSSGNVLDVKLVK